MALTTQKQAEKALKDYQTRKIRIEQIRKETGLDKIEKEAERLKKAATEWAVENGVERLDFMDGFHATLVKSFYGQEFIATDDDIPENLPADRTNVVSFQFIIQKKFKSSVLQKGSLARKIWLRATKRVIDRAAIDQLVAENVLTVEELAPCFIERQKTPYLRVFKDG